MNILVIVGFGALLLFVATRTYPFWIARIFGENDANPVPAARFADGRDYVKSPSSVVFAHHFASIAGAGPIVGPIIALAFGWGPAWVWIILGGIFIGGVHDMTSMFISVREGGKTIAEIARRTLGNAGYFLFVTFLLIVISFVNAIFLKYSADALSSLYPLRSLGLDADQTLLRTAMRDGIPHGKIGGIATSSVIIMTLAAPPMGLLITRYRVRAPIIFPIAATVCALSVIIGFALPVTIAAQAWMLILAGYVFIASWIPVWLVLQPRDFMNVQILYGGLALMVIAAIVAGMSGATMQIDAAAISEGSALRGPFWPMMFILIACGAISGFHSLVATGTTVKQIPRESDCRRIGYGAMILESFLALLVLVTVGSQLDLAAYQATMSAPGGAVLTFAVGCGKLFAHLGIPIAIGCVLGILIIEGFLVTTLDTSIRLARYLFEELWGCLYRQPIEADAPAGDSDPGAARAQAPSFVPAILRNPLSNTALAVAVMLLFAYSEKASQALWPFFGAGNQLIGALALTTVSLWLLKRGKPCWFTAIPAVFMVITAISALLWLVNDKWHDESTAATPFRFIIAGAGIGLLLLAGGFVVIAAARVWSALRDASRRTDASAPQAGEIA